MNVVTATKAGAPARKCMLSRMPDPHQLRPADVLRRMEGAAEEFGRADFVHAATLDGIVERLAPMQFAPRRILDLGAVSGSGARLKKRFPRSEIVALQASPGMLRRSLPGKRLFSRRPAVQANAATLPFQNASFDLVIANLSLTLAGDLPTTLAGVARVLNKGGVFAFATPGPDTLAELRAAWASVDDDAHVAAFTDMHDIGDAVLRAGLADPVLDVDTLKVTYANAPDLFRDLTRLGARNSLQTRRRGLTGKTRFARMQAALEQFREDGLIGITVELVFGHAWGSGPRPGGGEIRIDAGTIPHRRRR